MAAMNIGWGAQQTWLVKMKNGTFDLILNMKSEQLEYDDSAFQLQILWVLKIDQVFPMKTEWENKNIKYL
jgi:hypothetical protein